MSYKSLLPLFLCTSLIALSCNSNLGAQSPGVPKEIQWETFSIPGGAQANMARRIMQDSLGFIWFPTSMGLYRYDGTNFRHYPLSETGKVVAVNGITLDRTGNYWVGSGRNGLYRLDAISGEFEHFAFTGTSDADLTNQIRNIAEGPDGRIWLATRNGILAFDPQTEHFEHYNTIQIDGESLPLAHLRTVLTDQKGTLWFGAGYFWGEGTRDAIGGLLRFVPEQNDFELFLFDHEEKMGANAPNISSLYEDKEGYLWAGTLHRKLYRFDPRNGTFQQHDVPWQDLPGTPTIPQAIDGITEDCYGRLWLAITMGALHCYDPQTGATQSYLPNPAKPNDMHANHTWRIMTARDGAIWLAGGTATPAVYTFEPCFFPDFDPLSKASSSEYQVNVIEKGLDGNCWIGTQDNGLFRYQPDGGIQPIDLGVGLNSIKALHQDQKGSLWVGCWPEPCGLHRIDIESKQVETFRHDPANPNSLSSDLIMDIEEDKEGKIWIATWGGGLNQFDPTTGIFARYSHDLVDTTHIGGDFVTSLYEDKQEQLWIGGGGALIESFQPAFLDRFDPITGDFEHHFDQLGLPAFYDFDAITDITGAQDGGLWISKRGVIVHLDPASEEVESFAPSNFSRRYNWYWNIYQDSAGGVWSTSVDGLTHLNPSNQHFTLFPWHKLRINSNWWQPIETIGADQLIVGGQGGYLAFSARNLLKASVDQHPKVILFGFDNQGEAIRQEYLRPGGRKIWEATQIILPHNRNIFSLTLNAPFFQKSNPISVEYMLKDYDLEWRILDAKGIVSYFKVPPGRYKFEARVRSANGLVTEPSLNLDIVILAPWWQRWWVWTLYVVGFVGLSYFFYHFQLRRKLALAETQQLKEMDALKNRLYTNITHEFRTPLTIISGLTAEIEGHEKAKRLIQRNSRQLLELVNQILSLQKLEMKEMELRPTSGDIARFLNYLTESFQSLAQRKHLRLIYYAEPESIPMAFDEEKMQQLVANLISNAIKFTPEYGKVEVGLSLMNNGQQIQLKVRDSGVGIPVDQLTHIFDRFHQADNEQTQAGEGTGIGLALVKELVNLMEGQIEVKSQFSKTPLSDPTRQGSTFTVLLPRLKVKVENVSIETLKNSINDAPHAPALPFPAAVLDDPTSVAFNQGRQASTGNNYILLVEDNQDIVYYLQTILQDHYHIELAYNGREGLEKAFEQIPDIVISDVMMPEMDGLAFCAALKEDQRTSHIPVILLTAKASQKERLEGLKTGADAYLAKPFDKEELFIRIEKLLDLRKEMQLRFHKKDNQRLPDYQDAFLLKLQQVVEKNLSDEEFGTPQLCRAMAMSRTQLHRKIKALLDIPTARFIQLTRLRRARELILSTDKTIGEISFETGFKNPSYFTKLYMAEFEEKPSETRS